MQLRSRIWAPVMVGLSAAVGCTRSPKNPMTALDGTVSGTRLIGDSVQGGSLWFHPSVTVLRSETPAIFSPQLKISNPGSDTVKFLSANSGCTVVALFYTSANFSSAPVATTVNPPPGVTSVCTAEGVQITLPPGGSVTVLDSTVADTVPAAKLAAGTYHVGLQFAEPSPYPVDTSTVGEVTVTP